MMQEITRLGEQAKAAARVLGKSPPQAKAEAFNHLAELLAHGEADIIAANREDVEAARAAGLDESRLERLTLKPAILE
jgi:glutamate-5-semialdehyde dehydrogenase